LLSELGGHWSPAVAEEPWRLVTAIFLHAGLWHLGFNLLAIATIGPRIEALYGRMTMLFLFVATGTLANIGSGAVGLDGVGIGASGGMMGLIGVAAGYGQRLGTSAGRALRDDMLKWTAYTIVFGLFIGADNWAHVFGGLSGAAFGFAVRPEPWNAPRLVPLRAVLGLAGAVAAIGALVIIFTRTPVEADEAVQADRAFYEPFARMCRQLFDGDAAGARKAFDVLTKDLALSAYVPDESADGGTWQRAQDPAALYGEDPVGFTCENLLVTREWCRRGMFDSTGIQPTNPDLCAEVERAFGAVPERPRRPMPPVEAGDAGALP
jgi:membrane associated rhomboid family serine protease